MLIITQYVENDKAEMEEGVPGGRRRRRRRSSSPASLSLFSLHNSESESFAMPVFFSLSSPCCVRLRGEKFYAVNRSIWLVDLGRPFNCVWTKTGFLTLNS